MKGTPEPERLIKGKGIDSFGEFEVIGKWVLYKGQKNGRFMVKLENTNSWIAEISTWKDVESWEYLE